MTVNRDIFFRYRGDASNLNAASASAAGGIAGVRTGFQNAGSSMMAFGRRATVAMLPVGLAIGAGVRSLQEQETLLAQTNAVLNSMGHQAGVTADGVFALANEISGYSGVAHESVVEGQNLLLTFGNIRNEVGAGNDVFDQATVLLTDMSVALGQDMTQGAQMLGKALNDPIGGIAAMQRVGIQFTDEQKNMIAALVESGDVMGAQKVILAELEKQFGGSAEAFGSTGAGAIQKFKNSGEALLRTLTEGLLPVFNQVIGALQRAVDWFNNLSPSAQRMIGIAVVLLAAIGPIVTIVGALATAIGFLLSPVGLVIVAIAALAAGFIWAYKNSETFRKIVQGVVEWFKGALSGLQAAIETTLSIIRGVWDVFAGFFTGDWSRMWNGVKAVFEGVWNGVLQWFRTVRSIFRAIGDGIMTIFRMGWEAVWTWLRNLWEDIIGFFRDLPSTFFDLGRQIMQGAWDGIKSLGGSIKDAITAPFTGAWQGVKNIFGIGSPSKLMRDTIGRPLFQGVVEGLRREAGNVRDAFTGGLNALTGAAPNISVGGGGAALAGGGPAIHIHVAGSVVTEQELADKLLRVLNREALRNGTFGNVR